MQEMPAASLGVKRRIGPINVAALPYPQALALALQMIEARSGTVAFCNSHSVNLARRDPGFARAMAGALVLNDGIGLDLAGRLLHGSPFPANLNGTDFTPAVLAACERPLALYLLGSPAGVAEKAAAALEARFPHHRVVGVRDGFFPPAEDAAVAAAVHAANADLILVGMGQPRQELWAANHGLTTGAALMCIGAFLDFAAGQVPRAPIWIRRLRLEWLFRLALEPRRLARRYILGNGLFLLNVLRDRGQ